MGCASTKGMGYLAHNMPLAPSEALTERFLEKINFHSDTDCWEWEAATTADGYGHIATNSRGEEYAHRYMMALCGFEIEGTNVNHICDNPSCVNPAHLYTGSQAENVNDAVVRGDYPTGEHHHNAKLSDEDVRDIRERYAKGDTTQSELAKDYSVNQSRISRIINGERST